ncbi:Disintegrin and metalloproteinase domaincontaining protein 10like, partial [Caligus rogercresseyi]
MFAYLFLLFWFLHLNGIPGISFGEARICNLLIGHGKNISLIQDLALEHVRVLNSIFKAQVLNQSPFNDVEFRLGRLQVMFGSCDAFEKDNFLRAFDRHDFRDFCLAYLFSHLDFEGGTAGYASVGTVCQDSHNSGFITSLNYGSDRSLEDSALTFTHEVGHNFGAKHDSDYSDPECIKKDYIMNEVYDDSQDFDKDGKSYRTKFSECSIASMREKLGELSRQDNLCFKSEWDVP